MNELQNWFNGPSLLDSFGGFRSDLQRNVQAGELVDCYRNLNRANCFSVRARQGEHKGLVTAYGRSIVVGAPKLVVGEKSRQRCIENGVRNVHCFVRGALLGIFDGDLMISKMVDCTRVSYSPFHGRNFFQLERDDQARPILESIRPFDASVLCDTSLAILNGSDVFLCL